MLDIALLGTGGMMPLPNRFLTSLMLRLNGKYMLIDCGEGTQVSIKMLGWGFKNIDVICFTHYHADHVTGLVGLLLTIGNSGRSEPLTLIGPKGLRKMVEGMRIIAPELPFELEMIELEDNEESLKIGNFEINALKVEHMITCYAYNLNVRRAGKFDVLKANENNVPKEIWGALQKNDKLEYEGKLYNHEMVLGEERKGIKVTYCTDSRPVERLVDFARKSDLFICEGLYGEDEKLEKAKDKKHMIFSEAATLGKRAEVREMWLTHYSPALSEPTEFEDSVKAVFDKVKLGEDRMNKTIMFDNDDELI